MTVPLERLAKCTDFARKLCRLPILGEKYIVLLLQDLVDALVLVADLFEKLSNLRGIFNSFRRQLPQPARGAVYDELRNLRRVTDRCQRLRQMARVLTECRHSEYD